MFQTNLGMSKKMGYKINIFVWHPMGCVKASSRESVTGGDFIKLNTYFIPSLFMFQYHPT